MGLVIPTRNAPLTVAAGNKGAELPTSGNTRPVQTCLDRDSRFQVTDLEPGTYRAFAVTHYDMGLWQNAEFLRQMADRGVAVEVAGKPGAPIKVQALRAADVRHVAIR